MLQRALISGTRLLRSCGVFELCGAGGREFIQIEVALDAVLHLGPSVPPAQFFGLLLAVV